MKLSGWYEKNPYTIRKSGPKWRKLQENWFLFVFSHICSSTWWNNVEKFRILPKISGNTSIFRITSKSGWCNDTTKLKITKNIKNHQFSLIFHVLRLISHCLVIKVVQLPYSSKSESQVALVPKTYIFRLKTRVFSD